uniref:Uncharacterized protein n=1 Tax=Tanacetum cinerariifolium TaxID=118510 RepID=A0A6L2LFD9_TANCI|nr:hypothetical protein [Tanacetum cinerariifolium]
MVMKSERFWVPFIKIDKCRPHSCLLPAHSCVVDSTVSSIQPNVELASNIVTNSYLGDCIFDVGMTDTADNSIDVDPSIGSSSSTREVFRSTGRIRASWKLLVVSYWK